MCLAQLKMTNWEGPRGASERNVFLAVESQDLELSVRSRLSKGSRYHTVFTPISTDFSQNSATQISAGVFSIFGE